MTNPVVVNPNDFKVVLFTNTTDFTFTPEMGCMYDSRPIFGISGAPGINAGETMTLPYHVGHQLAINLAKVALTRSAPSVDPAGIPTGVPLWDTAKLDALKNSYLKELYTEDRPVKETEVDMLMRKVEELNRLVQANLAPKAEVAPEPVAQPDASQASIPEAVVEPPAAEPSAEEPKVEEPKIPEPPQAVTYKDKQEVLAELEKRGIKHDKRKGKDDLEKLLA